MTFLSLIYGVFLLCVLGIYWSAQTQTQRLWALVITSLLFYAALPTPGGPSPVYSLLLPIFSIFLLMTSAVVNFWLGRSLSQRSAVGLHGDPQLSEAEWQFAQEEWNYRRTWILASGIVFNVALLLSFKYAPFFLRTIGTLLGSSVVLTTADVIAATIIPPLGLSFFCFECIAYLIDIYRGAPATPQFLKFAAYKFFFPKLISGPITRYHPLAIQFKSLTPPTPDRVAEGLWLIACGALKKGLVADNLGRYVDLVFNPDTGNLLRAGSGDLWLATAAYGLQLYLDFSGYVDVALGSALLLGLNLPQNFDFPYCTTSIADFWRRWHMTLGDWLRNYLYFPLGGSRRGLWRTCLNLMVVMLIAGIWHGANWGFIVWGALHGLALVVHRLTDSQSRRRAWLSTLWLSLPGMAIAWFVTQLMVFLTWIFFRLPNLKDSLWVISHLWGQAADAQFVQKIYVETLQLSRPAIALLLLAILVIMGLLYQSRQIFKLQLNWPIKLFLVPICLYAVWQLGPEGTLPYIYFDF